MSVYQKNLAVKTIYKDILFRATLEATWAAFFDYLNIKWEYEPFYSDVDYFGGLTDYKIDFFLEEIGVYVEVKPFPWSKLSSSHIEKARGWAKEFGDVLFLIGPPSIPKEASDKHHLLIYSPELKRTFHQDQVRWCRCPRCGKVDLSPEGGIPSDCRSTCFSKGPEENLFGEITDEPPGHLDNKIKEACKFANSYF